MVVGRFNGNDVARFATLYDILGYRDFTEHLTDLTFIGDVNLRRLVCRKPCFTIQDIIGKGRR